MKNRGIIEAVGKGYDFYLLRENDGCPIHAEPREGCNNRN